TLISTFPTQKREGFTTEQGTYHDCNHCHDDELERIDLPGDDGDTAYGQQQVARGEGNRHAGFLDEQEPTDDGRQGQPWETLDPDSRVQWPSRSAASLAVVTSGFSRWIRCPEPATVSRVASGLNDAWSRSSIPHSASTRSASARGRWADIWRTS